MSVPRKSRLPSAIPNVVEEHLDSAEYLWLQRNQAVSDSTFGLLDLAQIDNRLAAHLYGIRFSGSMGTENAAVLAAGGSPGAVFTAAATALDQGDGKLLAAAAEAGEASVEHQQALMSAAGWIEEAGFMRFARVLLSASSTLYQLMGVAGYALRRMDLGEKLSAILDNPHPVVRARGCRAVAELGRIDLLPALRSATNDEDLRVRFWSAWAGSFLGDSSCISLLRHFVTDPQFAGRAVNLYFRICSPEDAKVLLRGLAGNPELARYALIGSGVLGDPFYVPGLIVRMNDPQLSRIAGHAFSLMCGLDLESQDLVLESESEPDALSEQEDSMFMVEDDDNLPWPDAKKIQGWWNVNQNRFTPGRRHLSGHVISSGTCNHILRSGGQHHRAASALELALHSPGQPIFEWRAPGYRQLELLKSG